MKYNHEIGKIYDTIFFLIEYFNPQEVKNKYINIYDNTNFMVDCYQQVKLEVNNIQEFLAPLFYSRDAMSSPMSMFFSKKIDYQIDNIDSFIVKITTQAEILYKQTYQYIFGDCENFTPATCIDSIKEYDAPVEFKLQLAMFFGNFTYAISEVASLLKRVYISVDRLHQKYEKELSTRFNQIQSDSNIQLYQHSLKYDFSEFDTTVISICLINQYAVWGPSHVANDTFLMLGYRHEESLNDYVDESNLSLDQFIISCGNELRLNILRSILKHGELTSSQMAHMLECPVTTMIRHINLLTQNNIIYISRREGLNIFYKINIKLFKRMQVELNTTFDCINNSGENNERSSKNNG